MPGPPKRTNDADHRSRVRTQFGASAWCYAGSDHARGESLRVLVELIDPQPSWTVLDLATGAGHTALALAPRVKWVIASDLTAEMLTTAGALAGARGLGNIRTQMADAEALPFGDEQFDGVTCRLAFHHFLHPARALAEIHRVLKPSGVLGFTDNYTIEPADGTDAYNEFERLRDPSHVCVYTARRLRSMCETAGIRINAERRLCQEYEFHLWADRQHVSDANKARLLQMLAALPADLAESMRPRWSEDTVHFTLHEIVLRGEKSGAPPLVPDS